MHFFAWKQGLKTGCYYLRTKSAVMAQKVTVDPRLLESMANNTDEHHSDDEEPELTPEQKAKAERQALKERLAKEYEDELQSAKDAAANGEGCLMCSG
jgi:ribonucleotide reductase alpha subunit